MRRATPVWGAQSSGQEPSSGQERSKAGGQRRVARPELAATRYGSYSAREALKRGARMPRCHRRAINDGIGNWRRTARSSVWGLGRASLSPSAHPSPIRSSTASTSRNGRTCGCMRAATRCVHVPRARHRDEESSSNGVRLVRHACDARGKTTRRNARVLGAAYAYTPASISCGCSWVSRFARLRG